MTTHPVQLLRAYLDGLSDGPVTNVRALLSLLIDAWPSFVGSDDEAMAPHKLDRIYDVEWRRPQLTFLIDRHGGTVFGSSRADRQRWVVDLDALTATATVVGYRQLRPRAPALDVASIAAEVCANIVAGVTDDRIERAADGSVRVLTGRVIPEGSAPRQTVEGRRQRFRKALRECLASAGWQFDGRRYRPVGPAQWGP